MFRSARVVALAAGGLVVPFVGAGFYISVQSNARRQRWYSDEYHLTPENMRMPFTRVIFHPRDDEGIDLEGWHIPQSRGGVRSNRLVVLNNPHNSNKSNLLGLAQNLWDAGYSVFLYDFRSHARNQSVQQSVGYFEQQDAHAALDLVAEQFPECNVAVVGASMGGAVALMTAHEHPQVIAVATDCAFARLDDVIRGKLRQRVPSWVPEIVLETAMKCTPIFSEMLYGYDMSQVNPEESVKNHSLPLFIIHSEDDELIPVEHAYRIFNNASTAEVDKEMWIIPDTNHIGGYFVDQKYYSDRISNFLERSFAERERRELPKLKELQKTTAEEAAALDATIQMIEKEAATTDAE